MSSLLNIFILLFASVLPLLVLIHCENVWIIERGYIVPDRIVKFNSVDVFIESILNETISIQSHSSIRFSPGDHFVHVSVNQAIKISNIDNLSITVGNPNKTFGSISRVTCVAAFGLSFVNVKGLQISGIHFEGCGAQSQLDLRFNEAVSIVLEANFSSDVTVDCVNITHGSGVGLLLTNVVGSLSLSNLQLIGNLMNCYIEHEHVGAPECFDNSGSIFMLKYEQRVENSIISFGKSCDRALCNSSAGGLTITFNQFHYRVEFHVSNVTLWNSAGQGNILVNSSSCSEILLLNFTNVKSMFSESYSNEKLFGLQYNELQCSCKAPISRNVSVSQSLFNRSCIHSELHDNLGLAAGVSYTNLNLRQTILSYSNCTSALELHSIYSVLLDSVEISESTGNFSLRVVNRLRLEKRLYTIAFYGSCSFRNNKGGISIRGDYVRLLQSTHLKFAEKSITSISENTVYQKGKQYGAIMYISDVVLEFLDGSNTMFINNNGQICGGITAVRSQVWFIDNPMLLFIDNVGNYGGAIALYEKSEFVFYQSNATIEFRNNSARNYGGGLFIDDSSYLERISNKYVAPYFSLYCCFPQLKFYNNSAQLGGSAMYGGWIDWVNYRYIFLIEHNISQFLHIKSRDGDLSPVASRPTRVCWCSSGKPDCSLNASRQKFEIYSGGTIEIMVVAIGQRSGTVASTVLAEFLHDNVHSSPYSKKCERLPSLGHFQRVQIVEQNCTKLKYTPASTKEKEKLKLTVSNRVRLRFEDKTIEELKKDPKYKLQFTDLQIDIKFEPCPFGYQVDKSSGLCTCISLPQTVNTVYDIYCNQHFQLFRKESTWVGAYNHSTGMNGCLSDSTSVVFGHCPFNLCEMDETAINISTLDKQCRFNRSGVLCGGCQMNLSRMFSSSNCGDCSGSQVVPKLIGYGLAGIGLIVLLLVLNLTISVGTINALIFYANIAKLGESDAVSFFPQEFLHSFLYKFIALVGMGTGIEACFYDGMSTYALSWILFVFPSYILLLSVIIITVSHYSSRASKWFGRNPVQVLATLFLLSYTSILKLTIINSAFAFTKILSVNGQVIEYVWSLDGNVPYLSKKHALLFAATMVLLMFICVPYTTVLVLVQWLQRYSHKRLLRWMLKLKPFIDAHTGPYKDKHRYWTGLLLLIRAGIFFLCTLNAHGSPLLNAALVMFMTLCLIFYLLFIRGVYKSRLLNIIEIAFLLNLCILSTSSFFHVIIESHAYPKQRIPLYIAYASVGAAFVYCCLVIVYHTAVCISVTRLGKCIREIVPTVITCAVKERFNYRRLMGPEVSDDLSVSQQVTHSSIAVRENDSLLS